MTDYSDLFVSEAVHEREVTLKKGVKRKLFFREVPAIVFRKFQIAERSDDVDVRAGSLARLICAGLCEYDGSPAMTYEQACVLKPAASGALLEVILEMNGQDAGND